MKSLGREFGRLWYSAPASVDCRWSPWSECKENSMQFRRITRNLANGGKDCENKTVTTRSCEREEKFFTCSTGSTIPQHFVCDEIEDCRDKSDELNCPAGKSNLCDFFICRWEGGHFMTLLELLQSIRGTKRSLTVSYLWNSFLCLD